MDSMYLDNFCRKLKRFRYYFLKTVLLFVFISLSACSSLLHLPNGSEFRSPDGSKVARIENGAVSINGSMMKHIYEGINNCGVVFSQDGQHVAYVGHKGGKVYLISDDAEYGPYDGVSKDGIFFGPTGNNFVLSVIQGEKWSVVRNGQMGKAYDGIMAGKPAFSDDGAHLAYGARQNDKWLVVRDGIESEKYNGVLKNTPLFTSDGKLVYSSLRYRRWRLHIDDWVSKPFEQIFLPGIIFSPDKSVTAFVGKRDGKKIAVINGKEESSHQEIGIWRTSLDMDDYYKKVMLVEGLNMVAMGLGGRNTNPGARVRAATRIVPVAIIVFSPDSQHYAYLAIDGIRQVIIVDGAELKELPEKSTLISIDFTGDSRSIKYKLKGNELDHIVKLKNL